jgi:hypothetical protein
MARAKATPEEPILSEEELAALAQEQAPVVEEAPANWGGHPTRAYRSFEWKAPECRPDYVAPEVQPEVQVDGQQEEPQV